MTSTKHTPGPWLPGKQNPSGHTSIIAQPSQPVAFVCDPLRPGEMAANAALIAAAPDLLEALRDLLECPDLNLGNLEPETEDAIAAARAAIAKAECPRLSAKIRSAIKSHGGAVRHARNKEDSK